MPDRFPHLLDLGAVLCIMFLSISVNYAVRHLVSSAEELVDGLHHYLLYISRWPSDSKVQEILDVDKRRLLRIIETR